MNENHIRISDASALMDWNREFDSGITMKEKQAGIIMDYLKKHGASLSFDLDGQLYWVEADKETIQLKLDDVIDQVCDWNYDELCKVRNSRMDAESYIDYCKRDDVYKKLLKEYRSLEKVFDQTFYGRDIAMRMRKLAAKTYDQTRVVPVYNLPQMDDKAFMPMAQETRTAYIPRSEQKGQVI